MSSNETSSDKRRICPHCGSENLAEAEFCQKCGSSLEKRRICPHCGRLTPADGKFCIYCGTRLQASVDEKSKDGSAATPLRTPLIKQAGKPIASHSSFKVQKADPLLGIASFVSSCLTLLVSLVFIFLIGVTPRVSRLETSDEGLSIYDFFFGTTYDAIKNGGDTALYGAVGPILGTIGVIVGLAAISLVTIFAIRAIVLFWAKKKGGLTQYAVTAYLVYLSTAILFMLSTASGLSAGRTSLSYVLNGATIAGIVLGAVFMVAAIVFDGINNRGVELPRSYLVHGISAGVLCLLSVLVLSFDGFGLAAVSMDAEGVTTGISYGILTYSDLMYELANTLFSADTAIWREFLSNFVPSLVFMILTFVLSIAFIVSFILSMKGMLSRFGCDFSRHAFTFGIVAGISAFLLGIVKIVFPLCLASYFFPTFEVRLASPIMIAVFGCLILAVTLAAKKMTKGIVRLPTKTREKESEERAISK